MNITIRYNTAVTDDSRLSTMPDFDCLHYLTDIIEQTKQDMTKLQIQLSVSGYRFIDGLYDVAIANGHCCSLSLTGCRLQPLLIT